VSAEGGLYGEITFAGQFAVERGALDQRTDARQVTGRRIKRPGEDLSATATWSDQAKQHPQRGRLAGPVRADESRHNTGRYLHVQSINDRARAIPLGQPSGLHDRTDRVGSDVDPLGLLLVWVSWFGRGRIVHRVDR
jgi:hypothetical protein